MSFNARNALLGCDRIADTAHCSCCSSHGVIGPNDRGDVRMSISGNWRSVVCRRNNHDRKPVLPRGGERKHLVRATLRHIVADQHLLLTGMHGQLFRLNDRFDPFQMGRKALAPARCTLAIRLRTSLADLSLDRSDAGLDLLEDKGLLFIVAIRRAKLFRSSAEPGVVEGL